MDAVIVTRKGAEQKKKEPIALVDIFPEVDVIRRRTDRFNRP